MSTYYSHGKLLLTGEYLVLHGAVALALPTKLGQSLTVRRGEERSDEATHRLSWTAYHPDGLWFAASIPGTGQSEATGHQQEAPGGMQQKLMEILRALHTLNPNALTHNLSFETHLEFNPEWGLGSSSTLINNLAQWAGVNPYELLKATFGGSGYDIACAQASSPLLYRLGDNGPQVQPIDFNPPFADKLYFVYQGHKQTSSAEVKSFNERWQSADFTSELLTISELSTALPTVTYFEDFQALLKVHENLLSHCLDRAPVQQQFPDFNGTLKSLGAWGGDFLLAATDMPFDEVRAYFNNQGLTTLFRYQDLIL